jgi:hypothetical protein
MVVLFLLVAAIAISIIMGGVAGFVLCYYYPTLNPINQINHTTIVKNQTAVNETNANITTTEVITTNGNVNLSSIEGNVTNVKQLTNGNFQLTVSSSKEHKYKDNVIHAIKKEAGQFANVCTVSITTKDNNESRLIYQKPNSIACGYIPPVVNGTPPVVVPPVVNTTTPPIINNTVNNTEPNPLPTCPTGQFWNNEIKQCQVIIVPPPPTPQPGENKTIKVIMTGDVGTNTNSQNVFNAIKAQKADNVVVLGDLGYASDLSWFKKTYGTLGNKLSCLIGNHEAANEDGAAVVQKEAELYCTNSYYFKKNHVLFLGFNTNGNLTNQGNAAANLLSNTAFMNGIKSVHIMSHKPCAVAPNAHHPVEIKAFCDFIKSKVPAGVKQYYDQAHNHVMSASADGTYKTIGAGGKSHYTCGVSAAFPFCDNGHFGYLQYTIQPDGTTTSFFYDYRGAIVK